MDKPNTRVEEWRVEDLRPFEGNPRKVPPRALTALRASIRRFGVIAPLVITPEGVVIAGHTRLLALKAEGVETARCVVFEGTEEEGRAYGLVDNRTSELTYWDVDKLAAEVVALDDETAAYLKEAELWTHRELKTLLEAGINIIEEVDLPDYLPDKPSATARDRVKGGSQAVVQFGPFCMFIDSDISRDLEVLSCKAAKVKGLGQEIGGKIGIILLDLLREALGDTVRG